MRLKLSYRAWMTMLFIALVAMIPVAVLLMRAVPAEGDEAKRMWLRLAGGYVLLLMALLVALVWVVLKDIRQSLERYRTAHRRAFEEMTEQIREDYRRRQQRMADGHPPKAPPDQSKPSN
ncbi:MAG: hypothetical protein NZL85_02470 [Fimbriimonadales bacterium]|nr:hypothetical protein [Fimbriimonadales bacterium]